MKIPNGEKTWVNYADENTGKIIYIVTSKINDRSVYFLYKVDGSKLEKLSKSENPNNFDKIVYQST